MLREDMGRGVGSGSSCDSCIEDVDFEEVVESEDLE